MTDASREALIEELRVAVELLQIGKVEDWDGLAAEILQAVDMLEADASVLKNLQQVVEIQAEIILEREADIGKLETDANRWREFQAALDRGEDRS